MGEVEIRQESPESPEDKRRRENRERVEREKDEKAPWLHHDDAIDGKSARILRLNKQESKAVISSNLHRKHR